MELYIIRHAQSENNALLEDQALRVKDPDLTPTGCQQADYLARFLAEAPNLENIVRLPAAAPERREHHNHIFSHVYVSPMRRTLQTAQPIAQTLGMRPEVWVEIHEHGGIFLERAGVVTGYGGMTRAEIEAEFPGYVVPETVTDQGWWKPEDGLEDISLCQARAVRVAKSLRTRAANAQNGEDRIAIVTHGTFMDCLMKALIGRIPSEDYYHWHYNTGITRVDIHKEGRIVIRYINRVTHLPAEIVT